MRDMRTSFQVTGLSDVSCAVTRRALADLLFALHDYDAALRAEAID